MKRFAIALSVLLVVLMACGMAFAASSKVTADCSEVSLIAATDATHSWDLVLSNEIHTANWSDLNVDVSLECGLYTDTHVKSKGGNKDVSKAEARVKVLVVVDPTGVDAEGKPTGTIAIPGEVTFCSRSQTLMAVFNGVIDSCTDENLDGTITLDECVLTDEEVQLILETMNANSFNFIIDDLDSGTHTVAVYAQVATCAGTVDADGNCTGDNVDAEAWGALGKGTMSVEEIRFIKGEDL
ncbi:MAG: hypothetical protein PVG55_01505 [Nitrospirota bacterium]|jgi:hypothetical protein